MAECCSKAMHRHLLTRVGFLLANNVPRHAPEAYSRQNVVCNEWMLSSSDMLLTLKVAAFLAFYDGLIGFSDQWFISLLACRFVFVCLYVCLFVCVVFCFVLLFSPMFPRVSPGPSTRTQSTVNGQRSP